jgi:hypothetical protein
VNTRYLTRITHGVASILVTKTFVRSRRLTSCGSANRGTTRLPLAGWRSPLRPLPLARHVQLRAQRGSFSMIAVDTVVAIPVLPAATGDVLRRPHPILPSSTTSLAVRPSAHVPDFRLPAPPSPWVDRAKPIVFVNRQRSPRAAPRRGRGTRAPVGSGAHVLPPARQDWSSVPTRFSQMSAIPNSTRYWYVSS